MLPLSSGLKNKPSKQQDGSAYYLAHAGFLLGLSYDPEDGGDMFLQNII
jgi:hypothetical protein